MENEAQIDTLTDQCFADVVHKVHQLTGITIGLNKKSMIQGRLRKRVAQLKVKDFDEYLKFLGSTPAEEVIFIDLVTTNETYFFRTPRIWTHIEKTVLPQHVKKNPGQMFHAWSAASSSGEEAHSLGVICQEFKLLRPDFSFQILGTDISQEMVQLCSDGVYSGRSIESFKTHRPEQFKKYLKPINENDFKAIGDFKSRMSFQRHNLFSPFKGKEKFDLILLRNVLIYFTRPDQEKVLRAVAPLLKPDGCLIIGESESLSHIQTPFELVEPLIYSHKSTSSKNSSEAA